MSQRTSLIDDHDGSVLDPGASSATQTSILLRRNNHVIRWDAHLGPDSWHALTEVIQAFCPDVRPADRTVDTTVTVRRADSRQVRAWWRDLTAAERRQLGNLPACRAIHGKIPVIVYSMYDATHS